jgi:hypothetical protein
MMTLPTTPIPNGSRARFPVWASILTFVALALIVYGVIYSLQHLKEGKSPPQFAQVTNRQYSLFLWQNPQYMTYDLPPSSEYVTGYWDSRKLFADPVVADALVDSSAEMLYLYHTWATLLKSYLPGRPIPAARFMDFLMTCQEWQPRFWPQAPLGYGELVESIAQMNPTENLEELSMDEFSLDLRLAFQGYENYFFEAVQINALKPTYADIAELLQKYPYYARKYWFEALEKEYPNYLLTYTKGAYDPAESVPEDELTPFLRVALFNEKMALENS